MSTQAAPSPEVARGGSPGTADGSPPDGAVPSQETAGQATEEGAEPESGSDGGGKDPSAEIESLRSELAATRAENGRYAEVIAAIDASPYADKVYKHVNGQDSEDEDDEVAAYIAENWPKTFQNEEGQTVRNRNYDVMAGLVEKIRADITRRMEAKIAPQLQGVQRSLASGKFAQAVSEKGIDLKAPEVQQFIREMERDPESGSVFKTLREKRPAVAAKWIVDSFSARSGVRARNVADRERVEMSRGAKLNGSSPRGGATAPRQFEYNPKDPQNTAKLLKFFESGGKREGIVYKK